MNTQKKAATMSNESKPDSDQEKTANIEYGKIVGKLSTMITSENLSTGDLAELRRISPDEPFTPALWRILLSLDLDKAPYWINQEMWERRWAILLMGMAHCAGLHDYQTPFGKALAEAGWSELRFVQLMRAKDETLEKHLRRVAQFLSSKNQKANWTDAANLLFFQTGKAGEEKRLSISRSYYKAVYAAENQ